MYQYVALGIDKNSKTYMTANTIQRIYSLTVVMHIFAIKHKTADMHNTHCFKTTHCLLLK